MTTETTDVKEFANDLQKRIHQIIQKLTRKLQKQQEELSESSKNLWYQQIADSLIATPKNKTHGVSATVIVNIHTQKEENISLNPKFDMHENAQLYYKKAKRAKHGEEICQKKVEATEQEIKNLNNLNNKILECLKTDPDIIKLKDLEKEINPEQQSGSSHQSSGKEAANVEKVPYRHFHTDGWDLYVGKNDTQNDELTTRFAKPSDIWLHVAGHAGSHVVIKRPKDKPFPPKEILEIAAAMAIWFSKAKHTSFAEVHYTEARFVHKRRHAPAGEVIAERCKSVRVAPRSPQEIFKTTFLED